MPALFTPYKLKDVTLRNRIAVPPMCQYMAEDGFTNDWHLAHYTGLAQGGAGLVIVEATGVSPDGRITPGCTGLWKDEQIAGMAEIAAAIKKAGSVPGIQIGHAGRKASANKPWEGDDHIAQNDPRGWDTISPSPIPFGGGLSKTPKEMSVEDIKRVENDFVAAAIRAREAGFEWLELHFAHGYLGQSFFSVHANKRHDEYGGDFKGRTKFLLDTLAAVRTVWPENFPLTARFGVLEFDGRDDETLMESIELAKQFRAGGLDFLNVSIGFSTMDANIPWGTPFMVPIAARVRTVSGLPVSSAWGIDAADVVENAIAEHKMDLVMIGRAHLANPHYPYELAQQLKKDDPAWVLPAPYAHWLARYRGASHR